MAASLVVLFACGSSSLAQTRREQRQMARQGHHAGEWLRKYKDLPPDQQQKALENDPQFQSLPAERQQKLRERLQHFNTLPPKRQQQILDRMDTWEHLTPEQKQQARDVFSGLQQLPPDRRQSMVKAIHDLRQMPAEQRQQAIDSDRYKNFTPEERTLLGNAAKLPFAGADSTPGEPAPEE